MRLARPAITILLISLLGAPLPAETQPSARVPRIGVLESSSPAAFLQRLTAFRHGLRELGYVEGQTILIESRWAHGKIADLPALAAELARLKVDVIFAGTTPAALAARDATNTIPIVIATVADPIGVGLISGLARPGGNVTGLTTSNVEIIPKRLQLLKEVSSRKASRGAMLFNPADRSNVLALRSAEDAARVLGMEFRPVAVKGPEDFDGAFSTIASERIDALLVAAGALTDSHARRIAELAAKTRVPAMYGAREFVEAGGLMSYSASFTDNYRRAASYVDKLLKGTKPSDLPVEQASTFEFVINLRTARALGLTIPPSLLGRADHVIE